MTHIGSGDPDPQLTDYYPEWLDNLANDVTLEGSAMDGFAAGQTQHIVGNYRPRSTLLLLSRLIHEHFASPDALHASFAIYRALDATVTQNQQRKTRRLTLPVLGIGGAKSLGEQVADTMKLAAADDVRALVIPGCGHHPPEEAPEETLAALITFLAPYRDGQALAHLGPRAAGV